MVKSIQGEMELKRAALDFECSCATDDTKSSRRTRARLISGFALCVCVCVCMYLRHSIKCTSYKYEHYYRWDDNFYALNSHTKWKSTKLNGQVPRCCNCVFCVHPAVCSSCWKITVDPKISLLSSRDLSSHCCWLSFVSGHGRTNMWVRARCTIKYACVCVCVCVCVHALWLLAPSTCICIAVPSFSLENLHPRSH